MPDKKLFATWSIRKHRNDHISHCFAFENTACVASLQRTGMGESEKCEVQSRQEKSSPISSSERTSPFLFPLPLPNRRATIKVHVTAFDLGHVVNDVFPDQNRVTQYFLIGVTSKTLQTFLTSLTKRRIQYYAAIIKGACNSLFLSLELITHYRYGR